VFQGVHYDDPRRVANYVEHAWDVILPVEDRLPTSDLLHVVPRVPWNFLQGSGYQVPAHSEHLLATTWAEHLATLTGAGAVVPHGRLGPHPLA
jgi:hypothetical protein